jgi:alcohol dehydrogenase, propanol-preferring
LKIVGLTTETEVTTTYKAYEITSPGEFTQVVRPLVEPGPGQIRLRVEACGVCHTDSATVDGQFPGLTFPRVPGHEVIGRIDAIGPDVRRWQVGQRVGVGFFGGEDGGCESCQRGDFINCINPIINGVTIDGGYAEVMIAEARATVAIPDELSSVDAAPLLCAGVTTFNALRNAGIRAGGLVAIQGIGGLGHLGIQFARRMGFHTVAIGLGADGGPLAKRLGARRYIDSEVENPGSRLQQMGGAQAVLATAPSGKAMSDIVKGLAVRGKLLVIGLAADPLAIDTLSLVSGMRSISGSLTGSAIDEKDALEFSVLESIRPMVETMPLSKAPEAYARMLSGKARFRIVLVTNNGSDSAVSPSLAESEPH